MPSRRGLSLYEYVKVLAFIAMIGVTWSNFTLSQRVWWGLFGLMIAAGFLGAFYYYGWVRQRLRDPLWDARERRQRIFSVGRTALYRGGIAGTILFCVAVWVNCFHVESPVTLRRCRIEATERGASKTGPWYKLRLRTIEDEEDFVLHVSPEAGHRAYVEQELELKFLRGRLGWWFLPHG